MSNSLYIKNSTESNPHATNIKQQYYSWEVESKPSNSNLTESHISSKLMNVIEKLNFPVIRTANDKESAFFQRKIDKLNLKFYVETQNYLNLKSDKTHCEENLFLNLFNQILIYSKEVVRLQEIIDHLNADIMEYKSEITKTIKPPKMNLNNSDNLSRKKVQVTSCKIGKISFESINDSLTLRKGDESIILNHNKSESPKENQAMKRKVVKYGTVAKDSQQFISVKENLTHKPKQCSLQVSNHTRKLMISTCQPAIVSTSNPVTCKSPKVIREFKIGNSPLLKSKARTKYNRTAQDVFDDEVRSAILSNLENELDQLSKFESMLTSVKLELSDATFSQNQNEYSSPYYMIDLFSAAASDAKN